LIANWKHKVPAGTVCDDMIDFTDFLPTPAKAVGATVPADLVWDGRSFLPQLWGRKGNPSETPETHP